MIGRLLRRDRRTDDTKRARDSERERQAARERMRALEAAVGALEVRGKDDRGER